MKISVEKSDKQELMVKVDNLTVVELLRVYLNKQDGVKFAAWKREHPSKPPVLHIKTSGKSAKKALQDAIAAIEKDSSKLVTEFKKAK